MEDNIIYEDDNEIITTEGAEDAIAIGVHVGCNGWVDDLKSSKGKRVLHCRACGLRVYV